MIQIPVILFQNGGSLQTSNYAGYTQPLANSVYDRYVLALLVTIAEAMTAPVRIGHV